MYYRIEQLSFVLHVSVTVLILLILMFLIA